MSFFYVGDSIIQVCGQKVIISMLIAADFHICWFWGIKSRGVASERLQSACIWAVKIELSEVLCFCLSLSAGACWESAPPAGQVDAQQQCAGDVEFFQNQTVQTEQPSTTKGNTHSYTLKIFVFLTQDLSPQGWTIRLFYYFIVGLAFFLALPVFNINPDFILGGW